MIPINIAKETIIGAIAATQITVHPTLDEYAGSEKPVLVQRQRTHHVVRPPSLQSGTCLRCRQNDRTRRSYRTGLRPQPYRFNPIGPYLSKRPDPKPTEDSAYAEQKTIQPSDHLRR